MASRAYPSDPTDAEWSLLEPHLPRPKRRGRPRFYSPRQILDAVFYLLKGDAEQIREWRRHFAEDRTFVVKSEDPYEHTRETLQHIVWFLGLPEWKPGERQLARRVPRYSYGPMRPETRGMLEEHFASHNRKLYEYLGVHFSW